MSETKDQTIARLTADVIRMESEIAEVCPEDTDIRSYVRSLLLRIAASEVDSETFWRQTEFAKILNQLAVENKNLKEKIGRVTLLLAEIKLEEE